MEQFANIGQATLNNGTTLSSGATSTTVSSGVNVPSSGTFRALIDTEIIKVTAVSGSTWTIVRGDDGTSAASHTDGATAYIIVTRAALNALVSIQNVDTEVSTRRVLDFDGHFGVSDDSGNARCKIIGSGYSEVFVPPVIGNFTFVTHSIAGTPTAVQQGNSLYIYHPGTSSDANVELYITPPATPYSFASRLIPFGLNWSFTSMGMYFGDGTKLSRLVYQLNNNQVISDRYSAWNTFSATEFSQTASSFCTPTWFKIRDDGTNKTFHMSMDGINWMQLYTESTTAYLASTTRVGFALNGNTGGANNGKVAGLLIQSWTQGT